MPEHHDPDLSRGRTNPAEGSTIDGDGDDAIISKAMHAFMAHPLMKHLQMKYAAEMAAMPSGTNTAMPTPTPEKDPADVSRNQRDDNELTLRFAKIEREHQDQAARLKAAEERNAELYGRYQNKEREGELLKLQRDGFQLDVAEELADCAQMDKAQFQKHLERIVRKYQKDPTGPWVPTEERTAETTTRNGAVGEMTKEKLDEALQYQREKGCEWKEAYEAVMKPAAKK